MKVFNIHAFYNARINSGMTSTELAERAGVTYHTIWNMENGLHIPLKKTQEKVAKALNVSIDTFYLEEGESPRKNIEEARYEPKIEGICNVFGAEELANRPGNTDFKHMVYDLIREALAEEYARGYKDGFDLGRKDGIKSITESEEYISVNDILEFLTNKEGK